ncbi:MAG: acetyltransferase [Gammaproteobacteria bacterium]|nr:acetyltransferase [Gammaproteobacteria bacterium]
MTLLNMTPKRLLLIGGGGHCVSCLDVIRLTGHYRVIGVIDKFLGLGDRIGDTSVIGSDDEIAHWLGKVDQVLITLGVVHRSGRRAELYRLLHGLGAEFAQVVSPRAYVAPDAEIGQGSIIMHDALVNSGARIGQNCIINTKSLIEHGASVGHHCHISTRATLNGDVSVGDNVLIGSHAVVFPGCQIGENTVVGGGQVVRKDLKAGYHPNREKRW